jgi:hypothetical protein
VTFLGLLLFTAAADVVLMSLDPAARERATKITRVELWAVLVECPVIAE